VSYGFATPEFYQQAAGQPLRQPVGKPVPGQHHSESETLSGRLQPRRPRAVPVPLLWRLIAQLMARRGYITEDEAQNLGCGVIAAAVCGP
jgi:hypothetical protein